MRRIKKKHILKALRIPWYSVAHGLEILRGGIVDTCKAVYRSFQRGPKDELGSYAKDISNYANQRFGIRLKKKRRSSSQRDHQRAS